MIPPFWLPLLLLLLWLVLAWRKGYPGPGQARHIAARLSGAGGALLLSPGNAAFRKHAGTPALALLTDSFVGTCWRGSGPAVCWGSGWLLGILCVGGAGPWLSATSWRTGWGIWDRPLAALLLGAAAGQCAAAPGAAQRHPLFAGGGVG